MSSSELLQQAALEREKGDFEAALKTLAEAMKDAEPAELYEAYLNIVLIHKHIFQKTGNAEALDKAEEALQKASEVLPQVPEPYSNLAFWKAEIAMLRKNYAEAAEFYAQALDEIPPQDYRRGDIEYHQGFAEALSGNLLTGETSIRRGIAALVDLPTQTGEMQIYNVKVWLSGAYLRLAAVLHAQEKLDEVPPTLQMAKQIIDSDANMVLRLQQYEKLLLKINQPDFQLEDALF